MTTSTALNFPFPSQFLGIFQRGESTYRPLLAEALQKLHNAPIPPELRPFYNHITVDNTQPSYILLPIIFLSAAEASGGITQRHIDSLPTMLFLMEVTAVVDDTVDRTPMRSGRMSFPRRFGDTSSTPFTGALLMLMQEHARRGPPEFAEAASKFVLNLFSLCLWEQHHTYPEQADFERWLPQRYEGSRVAAEFALNSAFVLNGRAPLPDAALKHFSAIFQDVDDIVGILEHRDEQGENDDLQMGIITRPLILTLARRPELAASVEQLWQYYRPHRRASVMEFQEINNQLMEQTRLLQGRLRAAIQEIGIPEAVRLMVDDLSNCLAETPPALRPYLRDLGLSVVDRLRRCGHSDLNRILDACFQAETGEAERQSWRKPSAKTQETRTLCVYCSSSDVVEPAYFEVATALGAEIGKRGHRLVFGGSNTGLMGAVAKATQAHGGEVISVVPEVMRGTSFVFEPSSETIFTRDLRARKAVMEMRADAFVVLPGGLGTLDETLEILASKQMHMHRKPIVFVNAKGFWEPLTALFEHLFQERFASSQHHRHLYHLAQEPEGVFAYLDSYVPPPFPAKWF